MDYIFVKALAVAVSPPAFVAPSDTSINTTSTIDTVKADIYGKALEIILLIAGVCAVLYIIYSGIQYITSNGSADKAKVAKQGVINAVIGVVIIYSAYYIIRFSGILGNTFAGIIK